MNARLVGTYDGIEVWKTWYGRTDVPKFALLDGKREPVIVHGENLIPVLATMRAEKAGAA